MVNHLNGLVPRNPFFWNGVAQDKPSEIEGSFSSNDPKPRSVLSVLNKAGSSSISLSHPLTFEIAEENNDLLNHITQDDIQELRSNGEIANKIPSIVLLADSILYSNIRDNDRKKLGSALDTIKLGLFSQKESERPTNKNFLEALIILKNNLPKIIGSRENYTHVILGDIKQLVESATKALEDKLLPV